MSRRKAASLARIGALEAFDALAGFEADAALAVETRSGVAVLEGASGVPVAPGPQATLAHEVRSNDRASARAHIPMLIPGNVRRRAFHALDGVTLSSRTGGSHVRPGDRAWPGPRSNQRLQGIRGVTFVQYALLPSAR
jgi:hypothetical protein